MASGPTPVTDFIFLCSKITADGDCSHEMKRCLLLGRKAMTNLDSILKSRDIADKSPFHQSYNFPSSHVLMWELNHKAEYQRIDVFELWCWKRLLWVPWTVRRSRKSVLNIHWKDWCWSSNTLATWCVEMTHWKRPWCWERLKAVGEGDDREWDGWMASPTRWTWVWASPGSWWWTGKSGVLQSMGSQRVRQDWATELNCVSSWAHLILIFFSKIVPCPLPSYFKSTIKKEQDTWKYVNCLNNMLWLIRF